MMYRFLIISLVAVSSVAASGQVSPAGKRQNPPIPPPDFFVIGVWQQPGNRFKTWAERGINLVITDRPKPDHNATRDAYFRQAAEWGIRVVIGPDPEDPLRDLQYRPTFLAWFQLDEPENWPHLVKTPDGRFDTDQTIANFKANYDRLKKLSARTPVWANFNGMNMTGCPRQRHDRAPVCQADYPPFMEGADWLSADWYVRPTGRGPERIAELIGTMCKRLDEWGGGKPFFIFLECCEQGLKGTPAPPAHPTAEEMRAVAWVGVIHGARGVIYFPLKVAGGFTWDNTPPELVQPMTDLNAELLKNQNFILKGKRTLGKDNSKEKVSATWTMPNGSTLSAKVEWTGDKWETTVTATGPGGRPLAQGKPRPKPAVGPLPPPGPGPASDGLPGPR